MADMSISWRIEGDNRVANDLRKWAKEFPGELDDTIGTWTVIKAHKLRHKPYPPERPNQTYVRTYTLKRGWSSRKIRDAVWVIENLTEYAGWVVDQVYQAWMHVGRWWIFQDEVRPAPDLTKKLTKKLRELIQ